MNTVEVVRRRLKVLFEQQPTESPGKSVKLLTQPMSAIEPLPIAWLWPEVLPLGFLSMLVAQEDAGKSTLARYMASIITTGRSWPNGGQADKGSVIWFAHEEPAAYVSVPSLIANGANRSRVHNVTGVQHGEHDMSFLIETYAEALADLIDELGDVRLVVLDPITSYTDARENSNKDVRSALKPMVDLAEEKNVCILGLSHLNKKVELGLINRTLGSRAWSAIPRMIWNIQPEVVNEEGGGRSETNNRLLMCVKSNLCRKPRGMKFEIGESGAVTFWDERLNGHADDVGNIGKCPTDPRTTAERQQVAEAWLLQALADGPIPATDLYSQSAACGVTPWYLRKAAESLHIIKNRTKSFGGARSTWSLAIGGEQLELPL